MIYIDHERCTGCGVCVPACPTGAIRLVEGETGRHAELDKERCQECEACVEICPEEAIMAVEPTIEGEVVQIEAKPVPVMPQSGEVLPVGSVPKALTWLGAAMVFAGREIVPRLAAFLLDVWDRRSGRSASMPRDVTSGRSAQRSMTNLPRGDERRHRWRRRGG